MESRGGGHGDGGEDTPVSQLPVSPRDVQYRLQGGTSPQETQEMVEWIQVLPLPEFRDGPGQES